jgi:hypothetical protein
MLHCIGNLTRINSPETGATLGGCGGFGLRCGCGRSEALESFGDASLYPFSLNVRAQPLADCIS